jgi:hypothetical protein
MTNNTDIHHRRSIRLKEYDYSRMGAYFVTICAWNGECVFGEITDGKVNYSDAGAITKGIICNVSFRLSGISPKSPEGCRTSRHDKYLVYEALLT